MSVEISEFEIQQAVDLSEKMLSLAADLEWDEVTIIETERRKLLTKIFSQPVSTHRESMIKGIRQILKIDQQIVKLGSKNRDEMRVALKKINEGKGAVRAYSSVG